MSGGNWPLGADGVFIGCVFSCSGASHAFIFRCHLPEDAQIQLSDEHAEYRWFDLAQLAPVQRIRVEDCLNFQGNVISRSF